MFELKLPTLSISRSEFPLFNYVYLHPFLLKEEMSSKYFKERHIGPRTGQIQQMVDVIGCGSLDKLIDKTVPAAIRSKTPLSVGDTLIESEYLEMLSEKASKNKLFKNFIGMGYHPTIVPSVNRRNILENPGWYTAYTPYQAEIAQGRLEALINFQTMVSDLTALPIANASLLDEGTAAAESMLMFLNCRSRARVKSGANKIFIDAEIFPQTLSILETHAAPKGIELIIGDFKDQDFDEDFFGAIIQYPNNSGSIADYSDFVQRAHDKEVYVAVASDLMALASIVPPGEWGADVVFGNSQRFGVPMGYGGPHAAFFATTESNKRYIPGRIIGVSKDRLGKNGYRMALQTREQHIKREKATSNICTAQALLAILAGAYAIYHGADGIEAISNRIHELTGSLHKTCLGAGVSNRNLVFFDTLRFDVPDQEEVRSRALLAGCNLRYFDDGSVGVSLNEKTDESDVELLAEIITGQSVKIAEADSTLGAFKRSSKFMTHEVFARYHSETEMMRYLKRLENRDLSLTHSMIALGSCTMKLNAASELIPITWAEFSEMHPFVPLDQAVGYTEIIDELGKHLCDITGFDGVSLQPNSGAQGEYAGLMVIRKYHRSNGDKQRNICLIPQSAHGTNPASAVMAGMKVVIVKCDDRGNVDMDDMRSKLSEYKDTIGAFMITYPSTHGVFEETILEMNDLVHEHGGQVYMDGANMNAQVGLTSPGIIGADVCHLNLHKTFAIPHGGGGPGVGPICVREHLVPFLPGSPVVDMKEEATAISSAPWGSALILLISYGYIKMLGTEGLTDSTRMAILSANYMKARLQDHFKVLYTGKNGSVAHEMILDCREFKSVGIQVEDIAKRLIDYGFHAPTVSFPVVGTIMVEPTESESLEELDKFCEALIGIRNEIRQVQDGTLDPEDNPLKNAPHTAIEATSESWGHPYSRKMAVYPASYLSDFKFWPAVARIDNAYGDRNLICTCPPIEEYELALKDQQTSFES